MWTLPTHTQIPIRRIEKPLRDLVQVASGAGSWDGDRLSVVLGQHVDVQRGNGSSRTGGQIYNLHTDQRHTPRVIEERERTELQPHSYATYWRGTIEPGEIFIVRRNTSSWRVRRDDTVTIFCRTLWRDDQTRDQLDVARDAILAAPTNAVPPDAYRVAREAIPHAFGLFIALVSKEKRQ